MNDSEHGQDTSAPTTIHSTRPDPSIHPELPQVNSILLSEGPRVRRELVHYPVHSRNTGEFKTNQITFRSRKKLGGNWQNEPTKSFTLDGDDQIRTAVRFISAACGGSIPDLAGDFVMVPAARGLDAEAIQAAIDELGASGQTDVLADLLRRVARERGAAVELFKRVTADPDAFAAAAATMNLARYRQELKRMEALIDVDAKEQDFQTLLSQNSWMFGSEYSEHLADQRRLTRDTQQDFLLRRTTDGYVEVIEIKTPLTGVGLFRFDKSRKAHFAGQDLSAAVGQVSRYIEELEADRLAIKARDGIDTLKIRAKIIIGRDGDKEQQVALRRFNGHLHRIEVITFDQLVAVARRVTEHLRSVVSHQRSVNGS